MFYCFAIDIGELKMYINSKVKWV